MSPPPRHSFNAAHLLSYALLVSFFLASSSWSSSSSSARSDHIGSDKHAMGRREVQEEEQRHLSHLPLRHISSMPSHSHLARQELLRELRLADKLRFHTMVSARLRNTPASSSSSSNSSSSASAAAAAAADASPAPAPGSAPSAALIKGDVQTRVTPGASVGLGQYLVDFALGTPAQRFVLIADTGSDLTWVRCSQCKVAGCSSSNQTASSPLPTFMAANSSTYSEFNCLAQDCLLVPGPQNATCDAALPDGGNACYYQYFYSDTSESTGILSRESVSLPAWARFHPSSIMDSKRYVTNSHSPVKVMPNISFGCSLEDSGDSFTGSDGVLGLGRGPVSFASQISSMFTYCLVDFFDLPAQHSFLTIGDYIPAPLPLQYTPFVYNAYAITPYYLGVEGIRVGGQLLSIPASVWEIDQLGNGGLILDSGTTLSGFVQPAYDLILSAMTAHTQATAIPKVVPPVDGFDLCFNASGLAHGVVSRALPSFAVEFTGGAVFEPEPAGNVFIDVDPSGHVKCLGMQGIPSQQDGFSVLGNLIQQNYRFVFDHRNQRLGFAGPTDCSKAILLLN